MTESKVPASVNKWMIEIDKVVDLASAAVKRNTGELHALKIIFAETHKFAEKRRIFSGFSEEEYKIVINYALNWLPKGHVLSSLEFGICSYFYLHVREGYIEESIVADLIRSLRSRLGFKDFMQ